MNIMSSVVGTNHTSTLASSCQKIRDPNFLGATIEEKTRSILGWTDSFTPTCTLPAAPNAHFLPATAVEISAKPQPPPSKTPPKKDRGRKTKTPHRSATYPYSLVPEGRTRKSSVSSVSSCSSDAMLKQQLTPPPSPATTSGASSANANVTIVSLPRNATTSRMMQLPAADTRPLMETYGSLPISPVSPNTPNPYNSGVFKSDGLTLGNADSSQQVFERIRELIPNIPTDNKNAYRTLIQTATSVIELEHKLETIKQETEKYRSILESRRNLQQQQISEDSAFPNGPPNTNCRMAAVCVNQTFNPFLGSSTGVASQRDSFGNHLPVRPQNWTVPDDLAHVDVSAFKYMVTSPPVFAEQRSMGGNSLEDLDLTTHGLDPLTVDTSVASFSY